MAIQYSAANYSDFKTFMQNEAFKGTIYYADIPENAQNLAFQFYVYAVDVGRRVMITLSMSGQTEQKPATFLTDFPGAIQLTGYGGPGFVAD